MSSAPGSSWNGTLHFLELSLDVPTASYHHCRFEIEVTLGRFSAGWHRLGCHLSFLWVVYYSGHRKTRSFFMMEFGFSRFSLICCCIDWSICWSIGTARLVILAIKSAIAMTALPCVVSVFSTEWLWNLEQAVVQNVRGDLNNLMPFFPYSKTKAW